MRLAEAQKPDSKVPGMLLQDRKESENERTACLDGATEVLTLRGWLGINEIAGDDIVAVFDGARIRFEKPNAIFRRRVSPGELMVVQAQRRTDFCVTEHYGMLVRTPGANASWRKIFASEAVGKARIYPCCGMSDPVDVAPVQPIPRTGEARERAIIVQRCIYQKKYGLNRDEATAQAVSAIDTRDKLRYLHPDELTLDCCRFIGFYAGDGTCTFLKSGGRDYVISQSLAYPGVIAWMDALAGRLGYDYRRAAYPLRKKSPAHVRWSFPRGTGFRQQARHGLFEIEPYLESGFNRLFWGLTREQLLALLDGFWYADGDHGECGIRAHQFIAICNTDKPFLDLLQGVAVCRGLRASVLPSTAPRASHHRQLYSLTVSFRPDVIIAASHSPKLVLGTPGDCVWCVQTPTNAIVTRRLGRVVIMGAPKFGLPN